ncbi:DUF3566 domain-containing protein [Nesterenkonia alba]|uniref:DUF3566 domain-containing protein n=1 Tax=Nesterenkonia alba TaxID=515814 RepID=UPI0003B4C7E8|nr:DUF3566 domain-containing protein [Nesterenkonia alba]
MSDSSGADDQKGQRTANRFPAPRPRASAPAEQDTHATRPVSASRPRPAAPRPQGRPQAAPRPTGRVPQQGQRPSGARGGQPRQQLVRPTPKAKVRKARLLVSKVDAWSVLKMSFLLSVALGIMTVVCAVTLWTAMDITGIFDRINSLAEQVLGTEGGGTGFRVEELVTTGQIASFATIIAVVNVVLLTVLSMLAAVLYNLSASLVGGIGVTLTDD